MDCWEYMYCPKEVYEACPVYPGHGRECWKVPHTMCGGGRHKAASVVEKAAYCRRCDYYLSKARIEGFPTYLKEAVKELDI